MRRRKLTDAQVALIRTIAKQRRETPTNAEIAAELGVSKRLVDNLCQGHEYATEQKRYSLDDAFRELCST